MQNSSHSASSIVAPWSSLEVLLLQIRKKNVAAKAKKKRKRIDASSKVIINEEWIVTKKLRIDNKQEKSKEKELKSLTKCSKEKKPQKRERKKKIIIL